MRFSALCIGLLTTLWVSTPHCAAAMHAMEAGMAQNEVGCPQHASAEEPEEESHCACCDACTTCIDKGRGIYSISDVGMVGNDDVQEAAMPSSDGPDHGGGLLVRSRSAPLHEQARELALVLVKRE